MSKKIEELFNLPSIEDMMGDDLTVDEKQLPERYSDPIVDFDDDHAVAMDKIYDETSQHASDLMEFGYNAEERSKATIFEKANMLYNTALTAKKYKRDAKHKEMELELRRRKQELDEKKFALSVSDAIDGEVIETKNNNGVGFFDRNDIVAQAIADKTRNT